MPVLDIPQDVYDAATKVAQRKGQTLPEWFADRVEEATPTKSQPTQEEIDEANRRLQACRVSMGRSFGVDNDQIDREIAEFIANHGEPRDNSHAVEIGRSQPTS